VSNGCDSHLGNLLLAGLPAEATRALQSRLQIIHLDAGKVLYEAGSVLRHVYFPINAVVSLVLPMINGDSAEVAVVGREGVVGVDAYMGGGKVLSNALVQRSGLAQRMSAPDIVILARDSGALMQQLLRYAQALFTQMAQAAACNRHHLLGAQLCRWLLQHLDRQTGDELQVTQERIAGMLGVRREGVTLATRALQREGLIRSRRGYIRVLDRSGLETRSCECYGVVRQAYERLRGHAFGDPRPPCPSEGLRQPTAPAGSVSQTDECEHERSRASGNNRRTSDIAMVRRAERRAS